MDVEEHLMYTKDHEWVNIEDNVATVGITGYAQEQLGEITFIQFPIVGDDVEQFGELASIESVKAASDIFSPLSGKIMEVNSGLENNPGLINKSCYNKGWIVKIEIADADEASNLMTADEYQNFLESLE